MHSQIEHIEPEPHWVHLDQPEDEPWEAQEDEDEEPPPDHKEDLVIDNVQGKNADSINRFLFTPGAKSVTKKRLYVQYISYLPRIGAHYQPARPAMKVWQVKRNRQFIWVTALAGLQTCYP